MAAGWKGEVRALGLQSRGQDLEQVGRRDAGSSGTGGSKGSPARQQIRHYGHTAIVSDCYWVGPEGTKAPRLIALKASGEFLASCPFCLEQLDCTPLLSNHIGELGERLSLGMEVTQGCNHKNNPFPN